MRLIPKLSYHCGSLSNQVNDGWEGCPGVLCVWLRAGLPGWLEESDPAGCDFVRDGRSMTPAMTDHTTCSGLGLIKY